MVSIHRAILETFEINRQWTQLVLNRNYGLSMFYNQKVAMALYPVRSGDTY